MSYVKQTWVDRETPLDAEHMNHIEEGIAANDAALEEMKKQPASSVVVDNTLSVEGNAADAKATGDAVRQLSEEISELDSALKDALGVFEASGSIVVKKMDSISELDVTSKVGYEGKNIGVSSAKLRVTGANIIDPTSFWTPGMAETKDGITCTFNDDCTITLNGQHETSGWTNLLVHTVPNDKRIVFPAGKYYIPNGGLPYNCGIAMNVWRPGVETAADASIGGKRGGFTTDEPFFVYSIMLAIYGNVSFDNVTFPVALYPGESDLNDPVYRGNEYSVDFGRDVYGGTYNWTTGELRIASDSNGTSVDETHQLPQQKIKSLSGLNVIVATCGDYVEVTGYGSETDSAASNDYNTNMEQYANNVSDRQNQQTLTIGLLTDTHIDFATDNYFTHKKYFDDLHAGSDYFNQDIIANLGDILTLGYTDKNQPLTNLKKFAYYFNDPYRNVPIAVARGNHDDNSYGVNNGSQNVNTSVNAIITPQEWSNICTRLSYPYAVFPDGKTDAAYFYIDNERTKIRTFILNTEDFPYEVVDGVVKNNSWYNTALSPDQVQFVADALHFADKDDPDDWAVLFLSHRPLDMTKETGKRIGDSDGLTAGVGVLWGVVDAFRTRTDASGITTDKGYTYNISADYTNKQKNGEFIAALAGHTHLDNVSKAVGNTDDACYGYVFMTFGTEGPVNVMIDRDAKVIHVSKRYGRNAYTYSHSGIVGNIQGLSSSGTSEWETVDADGCYKTQWTNR